MKMQIYLIDQHYSMSILASLILKMRVESGGTIGYVKHHIEDITLPIAEQPGRHSVTLCILRHEGIHLNIVYNFLPSIHTPCDSIFNSLQDRIGPVAL